MEGHVQEDSPLAKYFEGDGQENGHEVVASDAPTQSFAPKGRPILSRFQRNPPPPLWPSSPRNHLISYLKNFCSLALDSRLSRSDNARFLERFRYLIVASQLLNLHNYPVPSITSRTDQSQSQAGESATFQAFSSSGAAITALSVFTISWLIHWTRSSAGSAVAKGRIAILVIVLGILGMMAYAYLRRQWLQRLRQETLEVLSSLISASHDFDSAASNALLLIQEVELVSRGYQISYPLSPVSRIEDRSQIRRCAHLRRQFRTSLLEGIPKYTQACETLRPLAEELDLEKYFDIYEINDVEIPDALVQRPESEHDELDSVRVLKSLAGQYNTARKFFFCCLMALNADGNKNDFHLWKIAMKEIQEISSATAFAGNILEKILSDQDHFSTPPTPPKVPPSPGRERRQVQSRQLNSLFSGIRGLQAKLHVLREESDRHLDISEDVSEVCSSFMIQYESLGVDIKSLLHDWEEGKTALDVDRKEHRKSTSSGLFSPTTSLGGLTVVEEGSAMDALQTLNGEKKFRYSMDLSSSDLEEVFEAVANPRPRMSLSREERIAKMNDDRAKRESIRYSRDENTKMLRELKSVIRMMPKSKPPQNVRNSSI
ncbi:hypothetical protein K3495_g6524 [Podosphaera aphanis]|nr:hypothetical protein K3495_g6524 [Podosphaera aphanis]